MKRIFYCGLPLLLAGLLIGGWWRANHPVTIAEDLRIRALLRAGATPNIDVVKWSVSTLTTLKEAPQILSNEDREELLSHLWTAPQNPIKRSTGQGMKLRFAPKRGDDAFYEIYLGPTAASDWIYVGRYANVTAPPNGAPRLMASETLYALTPVSSRYIRRWLARRGIN